LPRADYEHALTQIGDAIVIDSLIAIADEPQPVNWLANELATVSGVTRQVTSERTVRMIPFHFREGGITLDYAQLDQIALNLYSTGELLATGRLTHRDLPEQVTLGHHVIVRLWAYTAYPKDREGLTDPLMDTPAVWTCSRRFWVSRGRSLVVTLTPPNESVATPLQRHFNQITHFKVELEYQQDR
jgi:hypothetical protein